MRLSYLLSQPFEAACSVPVLPAGHPSRRLHGHSFLATARVTSDALTTMDPSSILTASLKQAVEPLDYAHLNEFIAVPSDENIARWIADRLPFKVDAMGVQSTLHQGVDLDPYGAAHLWRRFRFEAAHFLPNVPRGHPCGRMHGHGFEVILHVHQQIGEQDLGTDLDEIARVWATLAGALDRRCLNDIDGLLNPTSEMICRWIWEHAKPLLPDLSWVTVYETITAGCHYDGEHFRIWKEQRFESAVAHAGQLLGHSYITRLHLTAPLDALLGWTVDYGDVRAAFTPVFKQLDHHRIDQQTETDGSLAQLLLWTRDRCIASLPALDRIDLFETPAIGASLHWGEQGPALPGQKP